MVLFNKKEVAALCRVRNDPLYIDYYFGDLMNVSSVLTAQMPCYGIPALLAMTGLDGSGLRKPNDVNIPMRAIPLLNKLCPRKQPLVWKCVAASHAPC